MGQPSRVVALGGRYAKDFFSVEDNAILVLGYSRGHSVCEGTWTQPATPARTPLMIYGTGGAIAVDGPTDVTIATPQTAGRSGSVATEVLTSPALPAHYVSGPAYFAHQILTDQPFEGIVSIETARDAQEILEAGLMSMSTGCEVGLPLKLYRHV